MFPVAIKTLINVTALNYYVSLGMHALNDLILTFNTVYKIVVNVFTFSKVSMFLFFD